LPLGVPKCFPGLRMRNPGSHSGRPAFSASEFQSARSLGRPPLISPILFWQGLQAPIGPFRRIFRNRVWNRAIPPQPRVVSTSSGATLQCIQSRLGYLRIPCFRKTLNTFFEHGDRLVRLVEHGGVNLCAL
jgi:hypothetical protein